MTYGFVVMAVGGRSDPAGFIAESILTRAETLTLDEAFRVPEALQEVGFTGAGPGLCLRAGGQTVA